MHIFNNRNNLSFWRIQIALKWSTCLWSAAQMKIQKKIRRTQLVRQRGQLTQAGKAAAVWQHTSEYNFHFEPEWEVQLEISQNWSALSLENIAILLLRGPLCLFSPFSRASILHFIWNAVARLWVVSVWILCWIQLLSACGHHRMWTPLLFSRFVLISIRKARIDYPGTVRHFALLCCIQSWPMHII